MAPRRVIACQDQGMFGGQDHRGTLFVIELAQQG